MLLIIGFYGGQLVNSNNNIYKGYDQAKPAGYDKEISHTDFGTPCGEYLRRYWHPVALTSEVSTTPLQIKIHDFRSHVKSTTSG